MSDNLTREQLEAVIRRGESVIFNGRVATTLDELPDAIDLAGDDIVKKQQAIGALKAKADAAAAEAKAAEEKAAKQEAEKKAVVDVPMGRKESK